MSRDRYVKLTIAIYCVWFSVRVLWQWASVSWSTLLGIGFLSAVNYFCLSAILQALQLGTPYSHWQDVLWVNWAVQLLSLVSSYAWLLWLCIPGYALYQYGPMLWGWLVPMLGSRGAGAGSAEVTEADKKRLAKKERQAERAQKMSGSRG